MEHSLYSTTCVGKWTRRAWSSAGPTRQLEPTSAFALEQIDADHGNRLRVHVASLEADRSRLDQQVTGPRDGTRADTRSRRGRRASCRCSRRRSSLERNSTQWPLRHRLGGLVRAEQQMASELASARQRVNALLSSGSWRITAPLRALLRAGHRPEGPTRGGLKSPTLTVAGCPPPAGYSATTSGAFPTQAMRPRSIKIARSQKVAIALAS